MRERLKSIIEKAVHLSSSFVRAVRKKWKFLLFYCAVVVAGCVLAASLTEKVTYNDYRLGTDIAADAGTVGLRDSQRIVMILTLPSDNLTGFYLDGFDTNGLVLTDETLEVSISTPGGKKICGKTFNLHDLAARGTDNGGGKLYVPFPGITAANSEADGIPGKGGQIVIRLRTHGLISRGVLFAMSNRRGDAFSDSRLFLKGRPQNWTLAGGVWEKVPVTGWYTGVVAGGIVFVILGMVIAWIAARWNLQNFGAVRRSSAAPQGGKSEDAFSEGKGFHYHRGKALSDDRREEASKARENLITIVIAAICPGLCLACILWGYFAGVRPAAQSVEPIASAVANDASLAEWMEIPSGGTPLQQSFTAEEDGFAGVGLAIQSGADTKKNTGTITVQISDEEGICLEKETVDPGKLQPLVAVINQTDGSLRDAIGNYVFIPLERSNLMVGETYVLSVSADHSDDFLETDRSIENSNVRTGHAAETGRTGLQISVLPEQKGGGPQLITLYRNHRHLAGWYWGITLGLLIILAAALAAAFVPGRTLREYSDAPFSGRRPGRTISSYGSQESEWKRQEPRFLVLFFVLGFAFSLSIPFYGAPDEKAHINTVYSMSNRLSGIPTEIGPDCVLQTEEDAEVLTKVDSVGFTAQHPVLLSELFRKDGAAAVRAGSTDFSDMSGGKQGSIPEEVMQQTETDLQGYEPVFYQNTMSNTTVFNYLPAVLGFSFGRLMGWNLPTRILLARWGNLIVCAIMIYAGIRKSPVGQHAMMAVALFPMLLQMAASCSYDTLIIGSAFLFIGYVFHITMAESSRDVSLMDFVVMTFSGALLLSSKQGVYLPVLCLLLLMPVFRKGDIYKKAVRITVLIGAVLLAVGFLPGFIRNFISPESTYVEHFYTLQEMILHPGELFRILGNTIAAETGDLIAGTVADGLASLYVRIPAWLIVILCALAVMSMAADAAESHHCHLGYGRINSHKSNPSESVKGTDQNQRSSVWNTTSGYAGWWILLIIVIGILFLDFAALFGMTPKGTEQITGLQGRYFLPYAVLIGLLPSFGFAGCRGQRGRCRGRSVTGNLSRPEASASDDRGKVSLMEGMGKRIPDSGMLLLYMGCADLAVLVFVFVQLYG